MKRLGMILVGVSLFVCGVVVGVAASMMDMLNNDSMVKESVYTDAIRNGIARQDTDDRVWWILPDGKEKAAAFDP